LGRKTRVLDDRKTGPKEVLKLREQAADIINQSLAEVNADIRVDHRSFKERGIDREPTTHLGPAASEMERRGEASERGDMNRQTEQTNHEHERIDELVAERAALDTAIKDERERLASPPVDRADARERVWDAAEPYVQAIRKQGVIPEIPSSDGLTWWQRTAARLAHKARDFAIGLARMAREFWREQSRDVARDRDER
jgi:hypothetical protein